MSQTKMVIRTLLVTVVFTLPMSAQSQTPQTQRYCGSGDKSGECFMQRYKQNIEDTKAELREKNDQAQIRMDQYKAAESEQRRQRTVQETGCNPRVQRCK